MSGGPIPKEANACAFVFFCLLCGGIFRELNRRYKVPYTPGLMILGILIGIAAAKDWLGSVGTVIVTVEQINPQGIIVLFIPTLLFESAMNTDWYVFKKSFGSILTLAGPGVMFMILVLGGCIKWVLGYSDADFPWPAAFILASIVATTDPVAVVALLKDVGAPPHFNVLVEV